MSHTGPCPEPVESSKHPHTLFFRSISVLSCHLSLSQPGGLFLSKFRAKILYRPTSPRCVLQVRPTLSFFDSITLIIFRMKGMSINYEATHRVTFSILLSFPVS
jgi:uncharacterized membrane protein YeiH